MNTVDEHDCLFNPLTALTNEQARKRVFEIMKRAQTQTFYSDTYWQGPQEIFKAMNLKGLDWTMIDNQYAPDMKSKTWKFTVRFVNKNSRETVLHGSVTAHGSGTVQDPLSRYDLTAQIF